MEGGWKMFEDVRDFLAETLNLDANEISIDSSLQDDLEIDSLDAVQMILDPQDRYNVQVSEEQAQSFKKVKDIVDFLEANK